MQDFLGRRSGGFRGFVFRLILGKTSITIPVQTPPPPPPETATAADGTHPTGMHSCLIKFNVVKVSQGGSWGAGKMS